MRTPGEVQRWRSKALVVASLAVLVAACSGGGSTSSTPAPAPAAPAPAPAAPAPEPPALDYSYFSGKTVSIVHGFSIGGGYDIYARLIAEELSKILGTDVIVEHQPGAGGLLATNATWAAPADGLRMTLINASAVLGAELAGADGVLYESAEFGWVGRVSSEPNLVVAAASNPRLGSLSDLVNAAVPVRFAATGAGSVEYIDPVFLREVFGLPIDLIAGFGGGPEAFQSVLAGDTDAQVRTYGSQRGPVLSGDAVPILIVGSTVPDEIAGTPTIFDIATGDQVGIAQRHADLVEMGRALIAPPGMDPEVLQLLRDAYEEIGTNQVLLDAAEADGRPISFMNGAEQYEVVLSILNSPASYVEVLREAFISAR